MDLRAIIKDKVGFAVGLLGTLNSDIVLKKITPGIYNPATGLTADVEVTLAFVAPIVRLDEKEDPQFPATKNVRVIIAPDTALNGYEPKAADYLTADGARLEVMRTRTVPGRSFTKIYVGTP